MWAAWIAGCMLGAVGCGGSTDSDGSGGSSTGGTSATGGATSGGTSGTGAASGVGGVGAGGASGGIGGTGGSGGSAGSPPCSELDYCECAVSNCKVYAEDCFCPCDAACQPVPCDCACGGGAFLGCGVDMGPFSDQAVGTWLIGWSGGLNHFSWLRLEPSGVARVLDGADLSVNIPFWECSGAGTWMLTAKPNTVGVYFPASCNVGFESLTFTLVPSTGYPPGVILAASIETASSQPIEGYKFPHSICDAQLTTCKDPL